MTIQVITQKKFAQIMLRGINILNKSISKKILEFLLQEIQALITRKENTYFF